MWLHGNYLDTALKEQRGRNKVLGLREEEVREGGGSLIKTLLPGGQLVQQHPLGPLQGGGV